jgi:hypothetical protein
MHTTSIDLSARISRKSFTAFGLCPRLFAMAMPFSRFGWYTSQIATACTVPVWIAKSTLPCPIVPVPMKAAVIRSLAPRAIRGKISVVNAAALAPFNRSRRVVDVGVVLLMDNLLELPF